jgi:CRISPR-associated protein Cmr2
VTQTFWQAKIWGLLHDPALKALRNVRDFGDEGPWSQLACMSGWVSPKETSQHKDFHLNGTWLKYVGLCDLLASASDRSTIGRLPPEHSAVSYNDQGLEICHLLSGKSQTLKLESLHQRIMSGDRQQLIQDKENLIIPTEIQTCLDARKVFWWFWRCYPDLLSKEVPEVYLLPAETRLPDASLWSHTSVTAALAGSLAGYFKDEADYPQKSKSFKRSRPHIANFTFTPIQELIKASRKMRDFWAGSWVLHYLSAKVCWEIAWKYGPDTMLYPCLYAQPLIDHWLLQEYKEFDQWITRPAEESVDALLTAGFPNVLVMLLPDNGAEIDVTSGNPVRTAMQHAQEVLQGEWKALGDRVLTWLKAQPNSQWSEIYDKTWSSGLKSQWQSYWVALPLGDRDTPLHQSPRKKDEFEAWAKIQNDFAKPQAKLFLPSEENFIRAIFGITDEVDEGSEETDLCTEASLKFVGKQPNLNVGSWWTSIFDQVRNSLNAVKNARNWEVPTAFGPRSTVSGLGSVVHPIYDANRPDWATEGKTRTFWSNSVGLFDGIEELNSTEVLKRGLHQVLLDVLGDKNPNAKSDKVRILYPDLSSGVAGWLREMERRSQQDDPKAQKVIQQYQAVCKSVVQSFCWARNVEREPWGIPWIHKHHRDWPNPRLLSSGWLIEEFGASDQETRRGELKRVQEHINPLFGSRNNPTDWYVLAAGDGDSMGDWLKGKDLDSYESYIPEALKQKVSRLPEQLRGQSLKKEVQDFLAVKKRMGPATHSALSRALLDFSNQLVPYLTEQRYAGRLIYGGGDDVLAYTNLWEWDSWLWDIHKCFRGEPDPQGEFADEGDYWRWQNGAPPNQVSARPLFTMGGKASISFGISLAHHSVPLAIALENLWEAEAESKKHISADGSKKNAVQVRVLYGNGNILKATAKFEVFNQWRSLLTLNPIPEPALFEQAAQVWEQHPVPVPEAIGVWANAFCDRREALSDPDIRRRFHEQLTIFLRDLWMTTQEAERDAAVGNWLKLAAFVLRKRHITIRGEK